MVTHDNRQVIVEAVGLTKVFKDFWMRTKARAVDHVDLEIHSNEIFGLLGPNGSGKSTIIKMILGLLNKTSGRLLVFGKLPSDVAVKRHIGFLPEESYLYRFLTARETLDFYGKLFGLDRRTRRRRTDELLEMVGLTKVAHRALGEYSKGMTRRIGLAQALINDPDFLILDEPTSGLDPIGTRQVKDLLIELRRRGKTILLSSHLLADVEDVCDRMVMLYGGRVRAQGASDELLTDSQRTVIETPRLDEATIAQIRELLTSHGQQILDVEKPRQRLEQLFLDIVEQAKREEVETSGAMHDGETASFLRGESAEGEQLIETLMTEEQPRQRAVERSRAERDAAAKAPDEPKDDVLQELMREQPAEERRQPPGKSVPAAGPGAAPQQKDVDDSVIQSLLGGDDDGDRRAADDGDDDDDGRQPRGRRKGTTE